MTSIRKILNKGLRHFRLELKRLPYKISVHSDVHKELRMNENSQYKNYHVGCGEILAKGFLNIDDAPQAGR